PPVPLARLPLVEAQQRRIAQQLGVAGPHLPALGGLLVEPRGGRGRAAPLGETGDHERRREPRDAHGDRVTGHHRPRRFRRFAIHLDLAAVHRLRGGGARLVEPGRPEPLVEPHAGGVVAAGHRRLASGAKPRAPFSQRIIGRRAAMSVARRDTSFGWVIAALSSSRCTVNDLYRSHGAAGCSGSVPRGARTSIASSLSRPNRRRNAGAVTIAANGSW